MPTQNNNIMNAFKKISSFTTQPNHFTGAVANKDLANWGKIHINFYVKQKTIGVEVAGFCSTFEYVLNPKNQKQQRLNEYFLERYILPCHNAEELLNILFV